MKGTKNILIIICLLVVSQLSSQTDYRSFKVISTSTVSEFDIIKYEMAITGADLERYRFETKSNILVFDTGFKVELKSAKECSLLGVNITSEYDYRDSTYTNPTPIFHMVDPIAGVQAPGQKPYIVVLYSHK